MYTTEKDICSAVECWLIIDPQGDIIADVATESTAKALLSHLNKD